MGNDDANPHGMFRPAIAGERPSLDLVGGRRASKIRHHRPPHGGGGGGGGGGGTDFFEDPDPTPPHGIPRPDTSTLMENVMKKGPTAPEIDPSRLIKPTLYDQDKRTKITIDNTIDSGHKPVDLSGSVAKRKLKVTEYQRSKKALKSIQ